jgi:UDP-3-O-[3-hydroxymyristoyl] glucosamine N-acyltransferase
VRLKELCARGSWELLRDAEVRSFGFIETALDGRLVFVMDDRNLDRLRTATGISAILATPALAQAVEKAIPADTGLAVVDDPKVSFALLHNELAATDFYGAAAETRVDPSASVHPTAYIDPIDVVVHPHCRIGPRAVILSGTTLSDHVTVMPGAVLGGAGFQVVRAQSFIDLVHVGRLVVGPRSVIMANAVVARAVFPTATSIGADCRIGNGAFISHGCQIGERSLIGHGAVVAGNCIIGEQCVLGPGAICVDRLTIGHGAVVSAGATVIRDVAAGTRVSSSFARRHLGSGTEE